MLISNIIKQNIHIKEEIALVQDRDLNVANVKDYDDTGNMTGYNFRSLTAKCIPKF